eukprot:scaffold53033_cov19-Tisochrysis_lutea.AAC.2
MLNKVVWGYLLDLKCMSKWLCILTSTGFADNASPAWPPYDEVACLACSIPVNDTAHVLLSQPCVCASLQHSNLRASM